MKSVYKKRPYNNRLCDRHLKTGFRRFYRFCPTTAYYPSFRVGIKWSLSNFLLSFDPQGFNEQCQKKVFFSDYFAKGRNPQTQSCIFRPCIFFWKHDEWAFRIFSRGTNPGKVFEGNIVINNANINGHGEALKNMDTVYCCLPVWIVSAILPLVSRNKNLAKCKLSGWNC